MTTECVSIAMVGLIADLDEYIPYSRLGKLLSFFLERSEMFSERRAFDEFHYNVQLVVYINQSHTHTHTHTHIYNRYDG